MTDPTSNEARPPAVLVYVMAITSDPGSMAAQHLKQVVEKIFKPLSKVV